MNSTEEGLIFNQSLSYFACAGAIICALIGTSVNFTTIFVISKRPAVRGHSTSPLLFNQAVTDFLFCFICLPILAIRFYLREDFIEYVGETLCQIWPFLFYSNINVSAYCVALISINRGGSEQDKNRWRHCRP